MMKTCAWDDENERFHQFFVVDPILQREDGKSRRKIPGNEKKIYTTLLGMFADEMKQEELEKDE